MAARGPGGGLIETTGDPLAAMGIAFPRPAPEMGMDALAGDGTKTPEDVCVVEATMGEAAEGGGINTPEDVCTTGVTDVPTAAATGRGCCTTP
mmetsp:Transcript_103568/g.144272  ORF Transcript_103568/g.144272 Transcript_103568/m.144272 type:complete len:93 (+) Transcript_103568:281-559(+)